MDATVVLTATRALPSAGESVSTFSVAVPAGTTKILLFANNLRFTPPRTVSSITFNGSQNFTNVPGATVQRNDSGSPYIRTDCWYLDVPTITTANIVVTWSGAARGSVVALCLSGAESGPPSATVTDIISGSVSSLAVASTIGGLVLSNYMIDTGDATTIALSAGTSLANFIGSAGSGGTSVRTGAASQAGTGSNVNTTWTETGTGTVAIHVAVSIAAIVVGPTIDTQPQDVDAIEGEDATFNVSATTSGGALSYDWDKDAEAIGTDADSVTLENVQLVDDGAEIGVAVTDSNGTTDSARATLNVYAAPALTTPAATDAGGLTTADLSSGFPNPLRPGSCIEVRLMRGATVLKRATAYASLS